jgi:aminoglycoside phosphotransferase (APT) family kinase protein
MNPETKLTTAQLEAICSRHHIPYRSHARITSGFSHEVHRLNDDLVIKLFNRDSRQKYETERAVLASNMNFLKPLLVASGNKGALVDRDYIIMSYVPGLSLGSHWHRANDGQRQELIRQICRSLQIINQIDPESIALHDTGSWQQTVVARGRKLARRLSERKIIDAGTEEGVGRVLERDAAVLEGSQLSPVYWDVHFDNFIVNESFELQALIDLENVELTAMDYPLCVVRKMAAEPEKFLREEDERFADRDDYLHLEEWYRHYYPKMFDFENLDQRVKIYELLDTLHLLVDWSHVKELYSKLDRLLA